MLFIVLALFNTCLPALRFTLHRSRWLALLAGTLLGAGLAAQAASWSAATSMATARCYHTSTLLPSGKVLVAGGYNGGITNSVELYDPAVGTWSAAAPVAAANLTTARDLHTATVLPSGKVLVVGGFGGTRLASAELFDPASNTWSPAGSLSTARQYHTATLLPSGKVLVAGGVFNSNVLNSAELYDPTSNTWSAASSLGTGRSQHIATLLLSGKVLVAGGNSNLGYTNSAELYDPASNVWSPASGMASARGAHTGTLLPSGRVLVTGGYNGVANVVENSAELYLYDLGISDSRRPVIASVSSPVTPGGRLTLTGTGFNGDSEAASGSNNQSATNFPLVQLRRVDNEQIVWTAPATASTRSATSYQSAPLPAVTGLLPGPYRLSVIANGLASGTVPFNVIALTLDIDDSATATKYDAATDGLLLMRYLLGLRGSALTDGGALGATAQRNATQIEQYIANNLTGFDVDGDGQTLATSDGIMILRRLLGIPDAATITQSAKNSSRSDADVVKAIDALRP